MSRVPRRAPAVARYFRNVEAIPVDYYVVFSELEAQLADEFDFVKEAAAMERIGDALCTSDDGLPCSPPLVTPRPVAGLVTRRVLVMDYLPGEPRPRVTAIGPTVTGPTATGPTATGPTGTGPTGTGPRPQAPRPQAPRARAHGHRPHGHRLHWHRPTGTGPMATGPTGTWSAPSLTRAIPVTQAAPPHPGHSRARC